MSTPEIAQSPALNASTIIQKPSVTALPNGLIKNKAVQTKKGHTIYVNRIEVPPSEYDLAMTLDTMNASLKRYKLFIKHRAHEYEDQPGAAGTYSLLSYTSHQDPTTQEWKRTFSPIQDVIYVYPKVSQDRALKSVCSTAIARIKKGDPECKLEFSFCH